MKLFSPQPLDNLQKHLSATYQATPNQLPIHNLWSISYYPLAMHPIPYTQSSSYGQFRPDSARTCKNPNVYRKAPSAQSWSDVPNPL